MTKNILTPIETRFWRKVRRTEGCWLWTGTTATGGYGTLGLGRTKDGLIRAHRFSYLLHFGPIPAGFDVCHHCDVRNCVRPDHLFLGTRRDNMQDAKRKGRTRGNGLFGERHPRCTISLMTVRAIRRLVAQGARKADVARRFGIAKTTVGDIVSGKSRRFET